MNKKMLPLLRRQRELVRGLKNKAEAANKPQYRLPLTIPEDNTKYWHLQSTTSSGTVLDRPLDSPAAEMAWTLQGRDPILFLDLDRWKCQLDHVQHFDPEAADTKGYLKAFDAVVNTRGLLSTNVYAGYFLTNGVRLHQLVHPIREPAKDNNKTALKMLQGGAPVICRDSEVQTPRSQWSWLEKREWLSQETMDVRLQRGEEPIGEGVSESKDRDEGGERKDDDVGNNYGRDQEPARSEKHRKKHGGGKKVQQWTKVAKRVIKKTVKGLTQSSRGKEKEKEVEEKGTTEDEEDGESEEQPRPNVLKRKCNNAWFSSN